MGFLFLVPKIAHCAYRNCNEPNLHFFSYQGTIRILAGAIHTSSQEESRRGQGHRTTGAIHCSPSSYQGTIYVLLALFNI
jgi:hypothetical protein